MDFDAFSAGVEPGGLRSKDQIRILICYLLSSVGVPLSKEDILNIMQENALANYFEVTDCLSELIEKGNVLTAPDHPELCTASDTGRGIAKQLDNMLPLSIRQQAVAAAINLLAKAKREKENKVEILKTERGYHVVCHISDGEMDLMSIDLYVPDMFQARMVKDNFHSDPENVYHMMLALMTGNNDLAADILNKHK